MNIKNLQESIVIQDIKEYEHSRNIKNSRKRKLQKNAKK